MEAINTTCATTHLDVTKIDGTDDYKAARLFAKLTFAIDLEGRLGYVEDDPLPVLSSDVETSCGLLPSDTLPFGSDGVELIVNGAAHAPNGDPTGSTEVSLTVGSVVHRALVYGDRHWVGTGAEAHPSEPAPFLRMPLTYERAFGGTTDVWLDEASVLPAPHPANPLGRGFDPGPGAQHLEETVGVAPGFPRFDPVRPLPNLEDPREPIAKWDDAPRPYCWSTRPTHVPGPVELGPPGVAPDDADEVAAMARELHSAFDLRCHPELLQSELPAGTPIVLRGMTPDGTLEFRFPRVSVTFDYHLDSRTGTESLEPRRVLLLPEERRFAVTYEAKFRFRTRQDGERSIRMRLGDS